MPPLYKAVVLESHMQHLSRQAAGCAELSLRKLFRYRPTLIKLCVVVSNR